LEVSQDFLQKKWGLPGLRGLAEEAALSGARFVRALYNLDSSLASSSGSAEGRALLTAAKSKAERPRSRSPRDERPPISLVRLHRQHPHVEESENLARKAFIQKVRRVKKKIRHETPPVKVEEKDKERERRGSHRPAEPRYPPRDSHRQHGEKRGKKRRGGKKHQRRYRDAEDPFRKSHRRLDSHKLDLAGDFREGLERRA
jgi:hypothetical protein